MVSSSAKVPLYTLFGILGALLFSMVFMYLFVVFILEYALNIYISLDNIGYYFIFAFLMTVGISGLFYQFYVVRQARWHKI